MSESGDPALLGRTIAGKYRIEAYLGGGAMGAVYRARQEALDRNVAVKVLHGSVAHDPLFVSRFHREARAASRLDHPNSMRVVDFGEEPDGLLYIAMEYLEGRDLFQVMRDDWPLSTERIVRILMQALAALAVAHDQGVVHRDLKPENIMILRGTDDEGNAVDVVKVCDFGIAKITDPDDDAARTGAVEKLTTKGFLVGTPEYMSPEQARGEKLDARSDLYAVGVILYQLLTGRMPFTGDSPIAIILKQISTSPDAPHTVFPGVNRGLEAVCMKALAKEREDRFSSAREMRVALRAALGGKVGAVDGSSVLPPAVAPSTPPLDDAAAIGSAPTRRVSSGASMAPPPSLVPLPVLVSGPADRPRRRFPVVVLVVLLVLLASAVALVAARRGAGIGHFRFGGSRSSAR
jgi:serine/threonine-protein kinase